MPNIPRSSRLQHVTTDVGFLLTCFDVYSYEEKLEQAKKAKEITHDNTRLKKLPWKSDKQVPALQKEWPRYMLVPSFEAQATRINLFAYPQVK